MRKGYLLLAAIGVVMVTATVSSAAGIAFSAANGTPLTITPTAALIPGAAPLLFKPSPKCSLQGFTSMSGFSHNAVHDSAIGVSGGQKYGMASDTNKVYFAVVEATTSTLSTINTSNSSFLNTAGNGFSVMK